MAEKDFIQSNGIPLRIAACNCLLGMTRDMEDFVEATESTTSWDGIVGASLRDPNHIVVGVKYVDSRDGTANDGFNDDAKALCTILQPYGNYPASIPVGSEPDNLIVMARGKIKWSAGKPVFPAITIKLRPYKSVLDYQYMGNTNASGEGEVGYEGKDKTPPTGGTEDLMDLWMFEGEVPPNYFSDYDGHYAAIQRNQEKAQYQFQERFAMLTLQETHYFENKDRPPDEKTPWEAVPPHLPNPTLYPRAPTGEAYNFKRNESWDCRYRLPSWWFDPNKNVIVWCEGSPVAMPAISFDGAEQFPAVEATEWQFTSVKTENTLPSFNPFFDPEGTTQEGIAPVIKGFYVDGELPSATGWKALAQSTSIKWYKEIRKRYSFSFDVSSPSTPYYYVPDNTVGAQGVYYHDYGEGGSGSYNYTWRGQLAYTVTPILNDYADTTNKFKCDTWWRMEISAPLAEWNWDEEEEVGTTISGWILLNKKVCDTSKSYHGNAWFGGGVAVGWNGGGYYNNFYYTWWSAPVTGGVRYFFGDFGELPAGEIPWSVTISKANAKEKDDGVKSFVPFFDFPIGGKIWVDDGNGGYTEIRCGDPIENGMSYISDFIVTAIETP